MCFNQDYLNALEAHWNHYSDEEKSQIIDTLIKQDYHLNSETPLFLRMNKKLILASLNYDIGSARYISDEMSNDPDVFKFLALNNYYVPWQIKSFSIDKILDKEIMDYFFEQLDSYGNSNSLYKKRVCDFFHKALHSLPKISTFRKVFDVLIEESWRKFKEENREKYGNVFAKICSYLRNNDTIVDFGKLSFGREIKNVLGEEDFQELYSKMEEYMQIYHSDDEQKMEKLQQPKDMISKFSRLYISKCKEAFRKEKIEECDKFLRSFYKLDFSNPTFYDKVSHYCKKRKFSRIYLWDQSKIEDFLDEMIEKYQNQYHIDKDFIYKGIYNFVVYKQNDFEDVFVNATLAYSTYLKYKKCLKLIHRLNSNYIRWDSPEMTNYKDLIQFDEETKQYIYIGKVLSDEEMVICEKYDYQKKVFHQIKKDFSIKIDELDLSEEEITKEALSHFDTDLPFTDEYFKFDFHSFAKYFDVQSFIRIMLNSGLGFDPVNFLNDASYQKMHEILIDGDFFWLRLMLSRCQLSLLINFGSNLHSMTTFINNMEKVVSLSDAFQIDISNVENFMLLENMVGTVDQKTLAILKPNTILKLLECQNFIICKKEKLLSVALNLVSHMVSRNDSTVPYIEGSYLDYRYSLYDALDEEILLTGIYTDACFKCGGNDNDFLHYCALNKNGFVLKITDSFGNFIGRASGFRHGNCIFFNQLRTIYDQNGNHYFGTYSEEQNDIIGTFQKACKELVFLSQNNEREQTPIDYVFVNKCYALKDDSISEIPNLHYVFGNNPMDITSLNWMMFVNDNLKNLQESEIDSGFYTDYGCYPVLCMASSNLPGDIENNLDFVDVEALYQRKRNQVVVTEHPTIDLISKINRTKAIHAFLAKEEFDLIRGEDGDLFAVGDNWYIIYRNHQMMEQCVLLEDRVACAEAKMIEEEISKDEGYTSDKKIKIYPK